MGATRDDNIILVVALRTLAALPRLVIPCEGEHVSQVFTELASARQAALSDAHASTCSVLGALRCIRIDNIIVLRVFEALLPILGQSRRM